MKIIRTSLIAALVLSVVITIPGYGQEAKSVMPKFEVLPSAEYDFGTIEQSQPVTHVFKIKNIGTEPFEITRTQASCGCTAAIASDKLVPPGKEASIEVKFTPPRGSRGQVTKTISIYMKDIPQPVTVLRIKAKVATDLEINPVYIQLMGAKVGELISGKTTIKNVTDKPVEISEILPSMTSYADTSSTGQSYGANSVAIPFKNFKLSITPPVTLQPGESIELGIELTPEYKGQVNGSLRLRTKKGEQFIQVFGVVRDNPKKKPK